MKNSLYKRARGKVKNLPNLLQRIGKILEHPKSFAAFAWYQLRLWIGKRLHSGPAILIYRHSGLGDVICSFPTVKALRIKYPKSFITYWTWKSFVPIVNAAKCADLVVGIDEADVFQKQDASGFDLAFYLKLADEDGMGRAHQHLVDDFAETLNVNLTDRQPRIEVPDYFISKAALSLSTVPHQEGPLVAIHTGPSWPVREWTNHGWDELVAGLQRGWNATVIQVGADVLVGAAPRRAYRPKGTIDMIGKRNILETAALIQKCDLFVGIDSGLLHLAGAVDTPSVGIFGAVNPKFRIPRNNLSLSVTSEIDCIGCHHTTPQGHWKTGCNHGIKCMEMLSADRALAAVDRILSQTVSS